MGNRGWKLIDSQCQIFEDTLRQDIQNTVKAFESKTACRVDKIYVTLAGINHFPSILIEYGK